MQVEALLIGIQQALKTVGDNELIQYLSSNMDFLMCYTVDLTNSPILIISSIPRKNGS
jgi:hypothetical protein